MLHLYCKSINLFVEDSIKTVTTTAKLSPITVNATPDQWSPNAYKDMSNVPSTAVVTKAKVSAKKSSSSGGYNHIIRVKLNNKDDYETVAWKSGEATIPELVGKKCSGTWYAGFKASELPQIIAGKPTYLGIVALSNFELTVTYVYEVYPIIEGLNKQFRKITKNKPSFTNDDSLRKILYLASKNIVSHWSVTCQNWDVVSDQLSIMFADSKSA